MRGRLLDAIAGRLRAELPLKLGLSVGLTSAFCLFYFGLQRVVVFPLREVPVTAVDRWVSFDPAWVWAYQSIYLLIPLLPWLTRRREDLLRYAAGFTLLATVSFVVFLLWPVAAPRPAAIPEHGAYRLLVQLDGTLNAFPSLHAGLTVYTFLYGRRMLEDALGDLPRVALTAAATLWTALILYATLATKQHWLVDLPAGMLLAYCAHRVAWRSATRSHRTSFTGTLQTRGNA